MHRMDSGAWMTDETENQNRREAEEDARGGGATEQRGSVMLRGAYKTHTRRFERTQCFTLTSQIFCIISTNSSKSTCEHTKMHSSHANTQTHGSSSNVQLLFRNRLHARRRHVHLKFPCPNYGLR
ncbi:hypothetical protein TGMAS_415510 [Toxoplasma gondii MAS]|uniref:Uncharacterized protein n=1 Tax=Toxoplasma gondii MAS TaxID=943118 RepID=A0A086Q9U7_TOXGO|nr:hypothetical protein TGMAS_415510 [Toxoplasma gondii MAS]